MDHIQENIFSSNNLEVALKKGKFDDFVKNESQVTCLVEAVHEYYRLKPKSDIDKKMFETLINIVQESSELLNIKRVLEIVNYQMTKEHEGNAPFKIASQEILNEVKKKVEEYKKPLPEFLIRYNELFTKTRGLKFLNIKPESRYITVGVSPSTRSHFWKCDITLIFYYDQWMIRIKDVYAADRWSDDVAELVTEVLGSRVELDLVTNGTNLYEIPKLRMLDSFEGIHISRHMISDDENAKLMGFKTPTIADIKAVISQLDDPAKIVFNCVMQKGGVSNVKEVSEYLEMAARAGVKNTSLGHPP